MVTGCGTPKPLLMQRSQELCSKGVHESVGRATICTWAPRHHLVLQSPLKMQTFLSVGLVTHHRTHYYQLRHSRAHSPCSSMPRQLTKSNSTKEARRLQQEQQLRKKLRQFQLTLGRSVSVPRAPRRPKGGLRLPQDQIMAATINFYTRLASNAPLVYHGNRLPSPHAQPFVFAHVRARIVPQVNGNRAAVVYNPHLAFSDAALIPQNINLAAFNALPTIYGAQPGNTLINNGQGAVYQGNVITTSLGTNAHYYSGETRFLGGTWKVEPVNTRLNIGGSLYVVHNDSDRSLIGNNFDAGTGNIALAYGDWDAWAQNRACTKLHIMSPDGLTGNILPGHPFFDRKTSNLGELFNPLGTVGSATHGMFSSPSGVYIPDQIGAEATNGWTKALLYEPAELLPDNTPCKAVFDFDFYYQLDVMPTDTNLPPQQQSARPIGLLPTEVTPVHPTAFAAAQNTIAKALQSRVSNAASVATTIKSHVARGQQAGLTLAGARAAFEKGGIFGAASYGASRLLGGAAPAIERAAGPIITEVEEVAPELGLLTL